MERIKATSGRILGVDLGDVRTGLAISDSGRSISTGLYTISVGGIQKTAEEVAKIARGQGCAAVIVGLPVNMDGSHGPRAQHIEKFVKLLDFELGGSIPVATFDERMTTMAASRYLNATDTRGQKRKEVIDTLSAQIILQNALDRLKNM